jgi:SAM-dependent methyltransferase
MLQKGRSITMRGRLHVVTAAAPATLKDRLSEPGVISAEAARRGAKPVDIDFSDAFLEIARARVPGVTFVNRDAQSLNFEDESFDAVVCGFGVAHPPEPARAISKFQRVVCKSGRVALSSWEAPKSTNGFGLGYGAVKAHGHVDVPLPHGPDFFQFSHVDRRTDLTAENP